MIKTRRPISVTFAGRGILGVAFAILTTIWPALSLATLTLAFAVYVLGDGAFAVSGGLFTADPAYRRFEIFDGLVGVGCAIALLHPAALGHGLASWVIGLWALASGSVELWTGIRHREERGGGELWAASCVSLALGAAVLLVNPGETTSPLLEVFLGAYTLTFGAAFLFTASRMRSQVRARARDGDGELERDRAAGSRDCPTPRASVD